MAPADRRTQRPVAARRAPVAAGQQPEPVVQPQQHLLHRQGPQPSGSELQRQRNPVEAVAELPHGLPLGLRRLPARPHPPRPLREQLHRVSVPHRGQREHPLPGHPQRAAPGREHLEPGARRSSSATRPAHASTRCSKPSITSSVRRSRRCSTRTARGVRLVWSANSRASIRACSSRPGSRTADSSAISTPSQYRFSRSAAARMTHRVLPTPATPTTVTSRASRSSSAPIPASSSSRPTKGLSSAGRPPGAGAGRASGSPGFEEGPAGVA